MKTRTVALLTFVLICIDQIIKHSIRTSYMDIGGDIAILRPILYFYPKINVEYSYINNLFSLGMGKAVHLIIFVLGFVLQAMVYDYFHTKLASYKLVHIASIFGFAGYACYFLDIVVWKGVLDYIYLKPFFVFDLKDVYLNVYTVLYLYFALTKLRKDKTLFDSNKFGDHVKNRLQNLKP